jgi:hypothetical protein
MGKLSPRGSILETSKPGWSWNFFREAARVSSIEVADAELVFDRDGRPGLLIRRFDRASTADGAVLLRAQEDGCEVLGRYPADKYHLTTEAVVSALAHVCRSRPVAGRTLLQQVAFASGDKTSCSLGPWSACPNAPRARRSMLWSMPPTPGCPSWTTCPSTTVRFTSSARRSSTGELGSGALDLRDAATAPTTVVVVGSPSRKGCRCTWSTRRHGTRVHTPAFTALLAFGLGLLGLACEADGGEPLQHQLEDTQREADALRDQVDRHHADAVAARDLADLKAIEVGDRGGDDERFHDLDHMLGDMHMCGIDDDDLIDHMQDVRDRCADDLDRHRDTIATVADLDAATAEEDRHHDAMTAWLDDLDQTVDELVDAEADAMCLGHHGMHDHHGGG